MKLMDEPGNGREGDREAALAGRQTESHGNAGLAGAGRTSVILPGVWRARRSLPATLCCSPRRWWSSGPNGVVGVDGPDWTNVLINGAAVSD
jgi:hypothetical protein